MSPQNRRAEKATKIQDVCKHTVLAKGLQKLSREDIERFTQQYFETTPARDINALSVDALSAMAVDHLKNAMVRKHDETIVYVFSPNKTKAVNAKAETIIEIITEDKPFLVGSVTGLLNQRGLSVHLSVHPVMRVQRNRSGRLLRVLPASDFPAEDESVRESYMHLRVMEQTEKEARDLQQAIEKVLNDVDAAVSDWRQMRGRLSSLVDDLGGHVMGVPMDQVSEVRDFLNWMHDDHFTLLGYREYKISGSGKSVKISIKPSTGLGILRDPKRVVMHEFGGLSKLPPDVLDFIRRTDLLMVAKTNARATVHRPVQMDYVGIKRIDAKGRVTGQFVFVGLFTASVYNASPNDIPILRNKITRVYADAGFSVSSHDGQALKHIVENFPRDELFQISNSLLLETCLGILHLQERQRVAIFVRRDDFERFISCQVFIPRDNYTTQLRLKMQDILEKAFNGNVTNHYAQLGESPLARLHLMIRTTPGEIPNYNLDAIEAQLAEVARSWLDRLRDPLMERLGERAALGVIARYQDAFDVLYTQNFFGNDAVDDIVRIEKALAADAVDMQLYGENAQECNCLRLKVYKPKDPLALSDVLPTLEHLGLRVVDELPYRAEPKTSPSEGAPRRRMMIHDFGLQVRGKLKLNIDDVRDKFHDTLRRIWQGEMESDGFNALVLGAGLDWREITILRAYAKYLRQIGLAFSQAYMEQTLCRHGELAAGIVQMFKARFAFDKKPIDVTRAHRRAAVIRKKLISGLENVASADEDRILRHFINLVDATLRTNFFQHGEDGEPKSHLSFKLDSRAVDGLPAPRPQFEIFVYSPRVEGVHLRFGPVARGGLRWSDRREDFRTEILGLVKAQQVKNAVIVPVGSKGGFVVKNPPTDGGREAQLAEGIACYQTFIRGLLDITDNYTSAGKVAPPRAVVRHDGDDPYLVVAADKGTATFSDIANAVSEEYGFWLGDAFASGGTQGYDHKKMGITARGGWESVKRHFREIGTDIQKQPFTAIGVGDMSGDVFGNGMLLSQQTKLVAAFNHMHIFIDPAPDVKRSFAERKRLFKKPRSGWQDYNAKLISKGGGVFERSAKWISVSPEMKALLDINVERVSPNDLIRAILKSHVDLLWFGGIGTYVKAKGENDVDVGDRTNDAVRVNGVDVHARVIGEGANLGLTQNARIEYALSGGRLNTDAIDNAGGVNCSDHEVNIKILLDIATSTNRLSMSKRNALLGTMTNEVASLVLNDNYSQSQAITLIQARGAEVLDGQIRLMRMLERTGRLDRNVEFLPDDETLNERLLAGRGLTRPEIAVVMSYAKIWLFDMLVDSDLPDDEYLADDLLLYFPTALRKKYVSEINQHRLKREIITTRATNSMINRVGGTFVTQMMEKTGMPAHVVARAYIITREVFGLRDMWSRIEALDNKIPAHAQTAMMLEINRLIERAATWFIRNGRKGLPIESHVVEFKAGISALLETLPGCLPKHYRDDLHERAKTYTVDGVPKDLALMIALLVNMVPAGDLVRLAARRSLPICTVSQTHVLIASRFRLGRMREVCEKMEIQSHWQKLATAAAIEELYDHQLRLTEQALTVAGRNADPVGAIEKWADINADAVNRTEQILSEMWSGDVGDMSMISVALRALRTLGDEAQA